MFPGFREKKRIAAKYPRLYGPVLKPPKPYSILTWTDVSKPRSNHVLSRAKTISQTFADCSVNWDMRNKNKIEEGKSCFQILNICWIKFSLKLICIFLMIYCVLRIIHLNYNEKSTFSSFVI